MTPPAGVGSAITSPHDQRHFREHELESVGDRLTLNQHVVHNRSQGPDLGQGVV